MRKPLIRFHHRAKRYSRYKSVPERTYARVQTCVQTQTSRDVETDMDDMDDCVAEVAAGGGGEHIDAASRESKTSISWTRSGVARRGRCNRVPGRQANISGVALATCRTVTSAITNRCCWRPLVLRCLHGTLRPSSLHSCGCASLTR